MTRVAGLGSGRLSAAAAIALILAEHPGIVAVDTERIRLPNLNEFPVNKPQRGKVKARSDYPGLTDEQRAWNQAVDKRKADKAARRTAGGKRK